LRAGKENSMLHLSRYVALLWAIATAIIIEAFCSISWWHPYCNTQADGPGYAAFGLPFPFAQPTGISSETYSFLPHIYALNIALLTAVAYPAFRVMLRSIADWSRLIGRIFALSGLAIFAIVTSFAVLAGLENFISYRSLTLDSVAWSDKYFSYRPSALAIRRGSKPCYF
jgi:hypothetical protein